MAELIHLVGTEITVEGRYLRQRCSWCGALLLDYDLASVARPLEEGEDPENPNPWKPATWTVGGFVAVDDHSGWRMARAVEATPHPEHEGEFRMPKGNCCLLLDPAVTA